VTSVRIGLLGGTFDPVHFGHLQLADAAMAEYSLDQVLFIPAAQPPHKDEATLSPFAHRVAMLEIAGRQSDRFACTTIEGELPMPSYTFETLRKLGGCWPPGAEFFFIIGVDAFLDLLSWRSYGKILQLVNIVVAQRKGYDHKQLMNFLKQLDYTDHGHCWRGKDGRKEIFLLEAVPGDFSSTGIRKKIRQGNFPAGDLPDEVIKYIKKHNLYQSNRATAERRAGPDW
jgi:nicotinate-nucleotide adenylyltransferase